MKSCGTGTGTGKDSINPWVHETKKMYNFNDTTTSRQNDDDDDDDNYYYDGFVLI